MNKAVAILFLLRAFIYTSQNCAAQPKPTPQQLAWHDMEFYLFMHFGPNTFTDLEWGHGTENEEIFDPAKLDCNQWCRIAKASGAKGIIITAKHHDGFCLWPSKFSKHTVRESKWKNGKGDVLKELSTACKKYGLKFGVYISPWDRNHPDYGTEKYNDVFVNMMKEILTNYGPVWELWWDGANGEGPNGKKQVYDWKRFEQTVRTLSPNTLVFSDIGPDLRWCGNESGIAGEANWNTLDTTGFTRGAGAPSTDTLNSGNINGTHWIPAEVDVSIRPGWFYHKAEDQKVKTPEQLFELYQNSVGRGANLLLNVPPDAGGLISAYDSVSLDGFKKLRDQNFKTNFLSLISPVGTNVSVRRTARFEQPVYTFKKDQLHQPGKLKYDLNISQKVNCVVLREAIEFGQQVSSFALRLDAADGTHSFEYGSTIGRKRIIRFPVKEITAISLFIDGLKSTVQVYDLAAYLIAD